MVSSSGTAFDCGRGYGAAAGPHIRRSLSGYCRVLAGKAALDWPATLSWAARYDECIGDLASSSRDEMSGVAVGTEIGDDETLAVNCRSGLLHAVSAGRRRGVCSSFVLVPVALANDGALRAQNGGWNSLLASNPLVRLCVPPGEPVFLAVGEAAQLAKVGVNAAELAVRRNTVVSSSDDGAIGLSHQAPVRSRTRV